MIPQRKTPADTAREARLARQRKEEAASMAAAFRGDKRRPAANLHTTIDADLYARMEYWRFKERSNFRKLLEKAVGDYLTDWEATNGTG